MTKTAQCQVTVLMPLGLHMRPADMLAKAAHQFRSEVQLGRPHDHERFDCKSILSIMTAAAVQGTELIVFAQGDDCEEAVAAVRQLFEEGFGELDETA